MIKTSTDWFRRFSKNGLGGKSLLRLKEVSGNDKTD
jgi:hypothetical protein